MGQKIISVIITAGILLASLVGAILFTSRGPAIDQGAVTAANKLSENGKFQEAIYIYEGQISGGAFDSVLLYNLGNTYYRMGDLGRAILNYQRAAQLDPRDAAIQNNLHLARSQAAISIPANGPDPISSLVNLTGKQLTINETALLALSLWFLGAILIFVWLQFDRGSHRNKFQYAWVLVLLLAVITAASLGSRLYTERKSPIGVVIAPEVTVSSGPDELTPTELNFYSGTEVHLLEQRGEWVRLSLPGDGNEGWLPANAIETVSDYDQISIRL